MPVVGFLNSETATGYAPFAAGFRKGLSETGFVEGRNVAIEYRWAQVTTIGCRHSQPSWCAGRSR